MSRKSKANNCTWSCPESGSIIHIKHSKWQIMETKNICIMITWKSTMSLPLETTTAVCLVPKVCFKFLLFTISYIQKKEVPGKFSAQANFQNRVFFLELSLHICGKHFVWMWPWSFIEYNLFSTHTLYYCRILW